jgi:hypothetical protein
MEIPEEVLKDKVKAATSEVHIAPDWAANMEICDMVNSKPSIGMKLASYLKKRITHKKVDVSMLALIVRFSRVMK